jgi:hypothetical protein
MEELNAVLMNMYLQHVKLLDTLVPIVTIQRSRKKSKKNLLPGVGVIGLSIEPQCNDNKN